MRKFTKKVLAATLSAALNATGFINYRTVKI